MSIGNVRPHSVLLNVGKGRSASRVSNVILEVGRCVVSVGAGILGAPAGNLSIVEDVSVGHAVACIDAVERGVAAGNDGDLLLDELSILNTAKVSGVAERLEGFVDGIQSGGFGGLEVNQQCDALVRARWVDTNGSRGAAIVVVQNGQQGLDILHGQCSAERGKDVANYDVPEEVPDVGLDADAASAQGGEYGDVIVVVVVAVALGGLDVLEGIQRPRVQRRA